MLMGQMKYHRDIWALGPSSSHYPGSFPRGFISRVRRKWWGQKRLWLFSGSFKDDGGTTVDIKDELNPDVIANCEQLPFESDSFDFVLADPPYSKEESAELYGLPYCNVVKVLEEMARVCKPGGHVLFFHRLVPSVHPSFHEFKKLGLESVVGVFTIGGMTNIRALSVFKKQGNLNNLHEAFL
jgi:SAM-dependent methyltransferase